MKKKVYQRYGPEVKSAFDMIAAEAEKLGEKHYACSWVGRKDGLYHLCAKEKKEWKVQL